MMEWIYCIVTFFAHCIHPGCEAGIYLQQTKTVCTSHRVSRFKFKYITMSSTFTFIWQSEYCNLVLLYHLLLELHLGGCLRPQDPILSNHYLPSAGEGDVSVPLLSADGCSTKEFGDGHCPVTAEYKMDGQTSESWDGLMVVSLMLCVANILFAEHCKRNKKVCIW